MYTRPRLGFDESNVVKTPVPDPSGYTKVMMAGAAADVYLATQMIQEVHRSHHTYN